MGILNQIKRYLGRDANQAASPEIATSAAYRVLLDKGQPGLNGWRDTVVAERQHEAFVPLLQELRSGQPRLDFEVAARAVRATNASDPLIIEVGCGSGFYSEVLASLLAKPVRYLGVDYSSVMTELAHRVYPGIQFVTGDACQLPFESNCCDILLSGTSLMHITDYELAIAESVRVSSRWCIFHTVPVMTGRSTTFLAKEAYGKEVVEVIFNRDEMQEIFAANRLVTEAVFESIPYDVSAVVGEPTWTSTYLCRKS